jgi:type IV pili sensor histidine kinase/response regulator
MKSFAYIIAILLFSLSATSQADGIYRISRYATVNPVATPEQAKPLSVVVTLDFTDQVRTVGDAIHHLLSRSGYRLADLTVSDPAMPVLLNQPLPLIHRHLGPITIENALVTLAGDAWDLVVDPVNRLVSFELLEQYRSLAGN